MAATCNWNRTTAGSWGTSTNWTCDAGGTNHVPIGGDNVTFGPNDGDCMINVAPAVVASVNLQSSYSGTLYQQSMTSQFLPVSGTFTVAGGTVNSIWKITVDGAFSQSGGTFNAPTTLILGSDFSVSGGTFTAGTGTTVVLTGPPTSIPAVSYRNLAFNDSLVGYWRMEESSGSTAADSSGYGVDLTWRASPAAAGSAASLLYRNTNSISLTRASSQYLDDGNTTAQVPNHMQTSTWSQSAWVKASSLNSNGGGGGACNSGGTASDIVSLGNNNIMRLCTSSTALSTVYLRVVRRINTANYESCISSNTFTLGDGAWHHLAAVSDGTNLNVYLDGTKTQCSEATPQDYDLAYPVTIGKNPTATSYYFGGYIDEVRVYGTALDDSQINQLYRGAQPGVSSKTYTLTSTLDVNGDLIIGAGTLAGSTAINVAGSWLNHGGFFTGTGAVTIDGSSGGSILTNAQRFNALTVNGTGTWSLLDRLWDDGILTITAGTLATNSYAVHAATLSKANGAGAGFTASSGTLVLDSTTPRILTDDSTLYKLRFEDPTETGLVGYWKLDAGVGTTIRDHSGTGNTGTLSGTYAWTTNAPSRVTFDNAGGLSFDGATTYVSLGTTSIPNPNATQSVAMWIYYPSLPSGGARTMFENLDNSVTGYRFSIGSTSKLQVWNAKSSGSGLRASYDISNTTTYPLNTWRHVAFTYDSATNYTRLYLNGVEVNADNTVTPNAVTTSSVRIGNRNTGAEWWLGDLDDVRVYNVALSASEVLALYNGGYPGRGGTTNFTIQANTTISSSTTADSGTYQTVYRALEDPSGVPSGFPAVAFDWANYTYHATYVAYNPSGGPGRIYKRDTDGAAGGYFQLASGRTFVGSPKFTHDGVANSSVYYVYAIDDQGTVYKLNDASFTSSGGSAVSTYRDGASATATSGVALDSTNIYWTGLAADGTTSKVFRLLQSNMTTASSSSTTAAQGAVPAIATISSTDYMFYANSTKFYKVAVSPSLGTPSASSWAPSAAVYGRVTTPFTTAAYFVDYAGKVFSVNTSTLATNWTYQDTASHGGSCSSGSSCAAKNLFVNWGSLTATGNVIFGDKDGHVYSLNTSTGAALSGYPYSPSGSNVFDSAAPLYRSGVIAIGNNAGKVFLIDQRTASAGTPAAISSYDFCTSATCTNSAVSTISYDFDGGQYVVATADGKLFYIASVADPTNSYN